MNEITRWLRQPSTLMAAGVLVGAAVYWLTRDPSLALAAGAVVPGAMSDHTRDMLAKIEALEDAVRPVPAVPSSMASAASKVVPVLALFAVGGILAGCATPVTPALVAQNIVMLDDSATAALAQLQGVTVPPAAVEALADLKVVAQAIGSADTIAQAAPLVQRVEVDVNAVAAAVATIPGPLQMWAGDAVIVLPVIEAAVNLGAPATAAASGKTVAQAQAELRAMAR